MSRRTFLKLAGVATAVVAGGAGGAAVIKTVTQNQLDVMKAAVAKVLTQQYGETTGQMLGQKILHELDIALAQLPNIGSPTENAWASNMPLAALALATYRVLVPEYATVEDVGHILYQALQLNLSGIAPLIMHATYNEPAMIAKLKALAARSQQRQYPDDWVLTFVDGSGQDFTYGVDVTECATQKYLAKQGVPALTRYLCLTDYLTSAAMGRGLVRHQTLAEGCAVCDFRFKRGRPSYLEPLRDGWPPKFAGA